MTKKYTRTLFNGVTVKLEFMATTGREGNRLVRPPTSQLKCSFSAPTFPEDKERAQAEFESVLKECGRDLCRAMNKPPEALTWLAPSIPLYEVPETN